MRKLPRHDQKGDTEDSVLNSLDSFLCTTLSPRALSPVPGICMKWVPRNPSQGRIQFHWANENLHSRVRTALTKKWCCLWVLCSELWEIIHSAFLTISGGSTLFTDEKPVVQEDHLGQMNKITQFQQVDYRRLCFNYHYLQKIIPTC